MEEDINFIAIKTYTNLLKDIEYRIKYEENDNVIFLLECKKIEVEKAISEIENKINFEKDFIKANEDFRKKLWESLE